MLGARERMWRIGSRILRRQYITMKNPVRQRLLLTKKPAHRSQVQAARALREGAIGRFSPTVALARPASTLSHGRGESTRSAQEKYCSPPWTPTALRRALIVS